jgi:YNFM family putative membrane transporter
MKPHALPYARFGRRNYEVRELSNVDPDANGAEAGKGYLRRGTPELRRANLAFFVAGLAMFAMLYCTQPLLPVFSAEFGVTPAVASLSLSLALILAGTFSEAWGRAPMMTASLGARLAPDDGS